MEQPLIDRLRAAARSVRRPALVALLHEAAEALVVVKSGPAPNPVVTRHSCTVDHCDRCAEVWRRPAERGCSFSPERANGACDQ